LSHQQTVAPLLLKPEFIPVYHKLSFFLSSFFINQLLSFSPPSSTMKLISLNNTLALVDKKPLMLLNSSLLGIRYITQLIPYQTPTLQV
jgi:hypothetical protein